MISRARLQLVGWGLIACAITLVTCAIIPDLHSRWWLNPIFVVVPLIGLHYHRQVSVPIHACFVGFTLAAMIVFGYFNWSIIQSNITTLNEYDFLTFWINGSVAHQGLNFYDPVHYHQAAAIFTTSQSFSDSILDVAFWYPAPSMFAFLPLGWFEPQAAAIFWNITLVLTLLLDIYLLWRFFLRESGIFGLMIAAALMIVMWNTYMNFVFSQTIFLLFLCVLMAWRKLDRPAAGVWIVLAACVKPIMAILGLYILLRRQWKALLAAVIAAVVICVITALAFGLDTFIAYFTEGVTSRIPASAYTAVANQSLLAAVLRITGADLAGASPLMQPLYLIAAALLAVVTVALIVLLAEHNRQWGFMLAMVFALLVYPNASGYYGVLLILPMLWLWVHRGELPGGVWGVIGFIALEYLLIAYDRQNAGFLSFALCWLVYAGVCLRLLLTNRRQRDLVPQQSSV